MKINGKRAKLTLLSAAEVLQVRRNTMGLTEADGAELSLRLDAALLALSLRSGGERLFADGEAALNALSVGQIRRFATEYEQLDEGARLDELRAPTVQAEAAQERNESFDEARFAALKEGRASEEKRAASPKAEPSLARENAYHASETVERTERSVYASVRPLSVQQLSQTLERDARRYDGGFTVL